MKKLIFLPMLLLCVAASAQRDRQQADSAEVRIDEVIIERDRAEIEAFRTLTGGDLIERYDEIRAFMQREVLQTRRKLSSARIEIGKDKARITQDLLNIRNSRASKGEKKRVKQDVKAMKDDQKDVRQLERYFKTQEQYLAQFEASANDAEELRQIATAFEGILINDLHWTQRELGEDRDALRHSRD